MTPYVQHVRFRKFSPVDREYPLFELVEGDNVLLDVIAVTMEYLRWHCTRLVEGRSSNLTICMPSSCKGNVS